MSARPLSRGWTFASRPLLAFAVLTALAGTALSCGKSAGSSGAAAASFPTFLQQRGLTFEVPDGYEAIDVAPGERWRHEHAVRSSKQKLEIRYGAAPKEVDEALQKACGGAKCPVVPSGEVVRSILAEAVRPIANEGRARKASPFPLDAVREEFSAHWGGVVGFDVDSAFAGYKQGVAVLIHREGKGSAMFVALYDEHTDALEDEWMRAFHSLRFSEPFAPAPSAALASELSGTTWRCDNGFVHMKFRPTTWTLIHISAAMAVMGRNAPYETAYYEVTYLPGSQLAARAFRVDNMEQGDRTPQQPAPEERFKYSRQGDKLVFELDAEKKWECERVSER